MTGGVPTEARRRLERAPLWGDALLVAVVAALLFAGVTLAMRSPLDVSAERIELAPAALFPYALRSLGRMSAAYVLSLGFTLIYGLLAARSALAERVLMPLLDVLQSVPILSFLPVVLLALVAVFPERIGAELAAIVLLFTSQAWNMTFAWFQALKTEPTELHEATRTFRFGGWLRFRTLELPHAAIALVWNSMMSWAGGWFFLMAAESFTVGERDFRLPGLGSYLHAAAERGDVRAVALGVLALVLVVVLLDQLVWRPLLAWADRFKLTMVASDAAPTSWFLSTLRASRLAARIFALGRAALDRVGDAIARGPAPSEGARSRGRHGARTIALGAAGALGAVALAVGVIGATRLLLELSGDAWLEVGVGLLATSLRVFATLALACLLAVPLGVAIGTHRRLAAVLQPIVQIVASVPATALFPILLATMLTWPLGLELAAILLMLMGTIWYILFNVIGGAAAIPEDLRYTSTMIGLRGLARFRTLTLPAIFPFLVTGAITASGGAWNASIVAEYLQFDGETRSSVGLGAVIARAAAEGNYPLLLAGTLAMIAAVTSINRLLWRPLYRLAERRYRME